MQEVRSQYRDLAAIVNEHREWATSAHSRLPLGFPRIDEMLNGGVGRSEVLMLLAASGVGKTAWACNVALGDPSVPTVFFSLEMDARFLLQRMAAIYSGTSTAAIEDEMRVFGRSEAMERMVEHFPHLAIVDPEGVGYKEMSLMMEEITSHWGVRPERVIVDYLELVKGKGMSSSEAMDWVSRHAKFWARKHEVALIVLHQLNQGQNRIGSSAPDMGHLPVSIRSARYGGSTAMDYTLGAYRPGLDPELLPASQKLRESEYMISVLKNRSGEINLVGIRHHFNPRTLRIK